MCRCLAVAVCVALIAVGISLAPEPTAGGTTAQATRGTTTSASDRATAQPTRRLTRCPSGLVALTFDDGPRPRITSTVVRILIRQQVPATFFMIGEKVPGHRRLVRRMRRHDMRVANHTYRHQKLTRLSVRQIRSTLRHTNRVIRRTGGGRPRLMRPPYGATNARVERVARDLGLTPVLWTVDSRDWDGRSADRIVSTVLNQIEPGRNTVLLHDGVATSDRMLAALPTLIRRIRQRGYCLAPLNRHAVPRPPAPRTGAG